MTEPTPQYESLAQSIHDNIDAIESSHETQLEIDLMVVMREIKQSAATILSTRIDESSQKLASEASPLDFDQLDARQAELAARNVLVEKDTSVYDSFLAFSLDLVPEAEDTIKAKDEEIQKQSEQEQQTALSEAETQELAALTQLNEALERPIKVPDMFNRIHPEEGYIDTFPREEVDITQTSETAPTVHIIDQDRAMGRKVADFLKSQPLLKTITIEDMFHLVRDGVEQQSIQQQLEYNRRRGVNYRPDGLLRSKMRTYLSPTSERGQMVIKELSNQGLILQRGGRRMLNNRGGHALLIVRLLSSDELNDPKITREQIAETFTDVWHEPITQLDISTDRELPPAEEPSVIEVEPAEIAKTAIKQAAMAPIMRRQIIDHVFMQHQDQIISASEIGEMLTAEKVIADYYEKTAYSISTVISIMLNPSQSGGKVTSRELKERGIVVERGIVTTGPMVRKNDINQPRVFRMRPAHSDAPSYPYDAEHEDNHITWENTVGEYAEPQKTAEVVEPPVVETSVETEPEALTRSEQDVMARTVKTINWLSENGVLSATHSPRSVVTIKPEAIPTGDAGEIPTKKLLRELKQAGMIEDDRNVTVGQLVVASLMPAYKEWLTHDTPERRIILKTVTQIITDFYSNRERVKASKAGGRRTR